MVNVLPNKKKKAKSDIVFDLVNDFLILIITLMLLYPLVYVLSSSISTPENVYLGKVVLFPKGLSLAAYKKVLQNEWLLRGYLNTIITVLGGTALSIAVTIPAGYVLSRRDFRQRNFIMIVFTITMFFSGGMVPTFWLIKNLGLLNNFLVLILPSCFSVWNAIVVRTYMANSLGWEIQEAARIDGCNDFRLFLSVVFPLCKPIIAVMALYYGVGYWNNYMNALLYISNRDLYPLQMVLRELLVMGDTSLGGSGGGSLIEQAYLAESIKYAAIVVSTVPILFIYPFLQKYFVKGVMVGSLKG